MKMIKLIPLFVSALALCMTVYGCDSSDSSSVSEKDSSSVSEESSAVENEIVRGELTDEQKKAAEEVGISEDRYCTDNTSATNIALGVLQQYYEGLAEADHEKCFTAFPDFYKKAIEDENKEYGDTNEEYMQSIKTRFIEIYGDDFKISPKINSVLQINDESMAGLQERINATFGTDIKLEDVYYIYFSENITGSLKTAENPLEFSLLCIDGNYLLYDAYFENLAEQAAHMEQQEQMEQPEQTEQTDENA